MLEVTLFGQFSLRLNGRPLELASRPAQTLLAYLLLNPGIAHRREQVAGLLWPDSLEETARKNLRNAVWQVRKAIGKHYLQVDKETVAFDPSAPLELDVAALARETVETGAEALIKTVSVYKGELLPGFYEDWIQLERERLRALFELRMQALLDRLTAAERWPEVLTWAEHWIARGHAPEPAYRALIMAHAAQGDLAGMATAYRRCVQALKAELEVPPSPETQALYERLSRGEAPGGAAGAPRTPEFAADPAQRYVEQELLALGGQGEVYRGQDRVTGQPVVIKRLPRSAAARSPELAARIIREGELLRQLDHPNIVKILATFEREGQPAIVMEHVPGGALQDLLDSKTPLPIQRILDIGLELADALSRTHHLGVIHRDLKPGNVLLAADGTPRLTDFGLARFEHRASPARLTQTGMVVGSPIYMSPEALQNQELDARSDVWSFGVLLYEMLAGRAPFEGDDLAPLIAQILREPAPAITRFRPDTPTALADLIQRMLLKDRDQRVSSMRQVAAELEAIRAGRPVERITAQEGGPSPQLSDASPRPRDTHDTPTRRVMEQRIHFCTSPDGVRIAYAVVGEGPVLVKVANWLSHLEYDWNSPVWRHWLTELARSHTLVRYDKRGCGLSDWDVEDFSLGAQVEDLETVVNTLGLNRFPLFGLSGGGPIAVAYAVRHPEKVSHLILYGSYVRGRLRRSQSPAQLEEAQMLLKVMELGWGKANPAFRQVYTGLFVPEGTAEQVRWFNDLQRISTSPEIAVRIFNGSFSVDIGDLAPSVTVPTLVLHARDDALVPFEEGRQLATLIPGARFAPLEGKNHILLEHESAWPRFLDEVHQFLQAEPEAPPSPMSREVTPPSRRTPSMETEPTVRHNLPAQPTPFVGREQKLAEVRQLLAAEPACRLLTLVGPGGIGKTRLALAAASSVLSAFPGGVYFVPLASVGEAAHVVPAIVKAIGLNPSGPTPPKTQLLHHLRDAKQPLLLLLDNLEHVLEGADALAELLSAAPQLKVLATSRERLNLQEEWVFEVRGMASPPVGAPLANIADLEKYNAARLFLQRARQADARFHPSTEDVPAIARLCRLVDGIPLGLELAAPWVRSMTCREIADEIERNLDFLTTTVRNVPERHRSLRAVLEQTWERLTQEERDVLRQLSVFRGGCTREAAETVIGASVAALSSLMGRALLRRVRDGRYELHELIRQFAAEQLQPGDQEAAQERHSAYYTTLLEQRIADLKGGRQKEALDEIAADIDNVRAAWGCAVARRGASALERAAQALWLFCEYRGALSEGEEAFGYAASAFMTDDSGVADGLERPVGFLLAAWGSLCARRGEFAKGRGWMQQGIVLLRRAESPDRQKEAFALAWLGFICILHREYDAAQQHAQESLALYPQTGDSWTRAGCLRLLGAAALYQARLQEAEEYLRQCLAACREIGERRIRTYASLNLSQISQLRGEYARAGELLEEALTISQELGDRLSQAALLSELGRLATARGEYGRAIQLIQDSLAIQRQISQSDVSWSFSRLGAAYRVLGEDVEAEQAYQESLAAARAAGHQLNIALALSGLGRVAHDRAQYRQAEQFQRDALTLWQRMEHEPEIASVLRHLGHTLVALDAAREPEARQAFGQALRLTVKHGLAPVALDVFVGVAPLLAREDETQRAVELLSLARHHPASTHETKEKARHRLTELSGDDLHADLASRAVAQGLLLDWRGQASRLFEELSGSDSD